MKAVGWSGSIYLVVADGEWMGCREAEAFRKKRFLHKISEILALAWGLRTTRVDSDVSGAVAF